MKISGILDTRLETTFTEVSMIIASPIHRPNPKPLIFSFASPMVSHPRETGRILSPRVRHIVLSVDQTKESSSARHTYVSVVGIGPSQRARDLETLSYSSYSHTWAECLAC